MLLSLKTGIERLLMAVVSSMLAVMTCLMLWQVITRYLLARPAIFTEEALRFMMIWMALLGTAYCFGARKHLSLELIPALSPPRVQKILMVVNGLIGIAFAIGVMLIGGWGASSSAMTQLSPVIQLPMGVIYLAVPVSAVLIVVLQALDIALVLTGQRPALEQQGDMI